MISIRLRPWVEIDGVTQTATSYSISDTVDFANIIYEDLEDENDITMHYCDVVVPQGSVYYGRIKRHLSDGTVIGWSNPQPIYPNISDSSLLLLADISIEAPTVNINKEDLLDPSKDTVTITSSSFRGKGDGHGYTHWVITDYFDNILYSKLYDSVNLLSITVNKNDINLNNVSYLKVNAIHGSNLQAESEAGVKTISLVEVNFDIKSIIDKVPPNVSYNLEIVKREPTLHTGIKHIALLNTDDDSILWEEDVNGDTTTFTIPAEVLASDSAYLVKFTVVNFNTPEVYVIKILTTSKNIDTFEVNKNHNYKKKLTYINDLNITNYVKYYNSKESYDGTIPLLKTDNNKKLLKYTFDGMFHSQDEFNNVLCLTNATDGYLASYRPDNLILIENLNSDNKPTFMLYQYDPYRDTSVLLRSVVRDEDNLVKNNELVIYDVNTYFYIEQTDKKLMKLDIRDMSITEYDDISYAHGPITLIDLGMGKLGFIQYDVNDIIVYDIKDKTYIVDINIDAKFLNRDITPIKLINGDSIIVRTLSDTEDTDSDVMYYDSYNHRMLLVSNSINGINYESSVLLKDGTVVLVDVSNSKMYKFI